MILKYQLINLNYPKIINMGTSQSKTNTYNFNLH